MPTNHPKLWWHEPEGDRDHLGVAKERMRPRITADGQVRSCLFSRRETDLRAVLRGGGSDDDLAEAWVGAHRVKPRAHGIDEDGFLPPIRTMSAIGG